MSKPQPKNAFRPDHALTPGAYIQSCRQRADLSIEECASRIALRPEDQCHARNDLQLLEDDQPGDYGRLVDQLHGRSVFAFDRGTFAALAAATSDETVDPWGAS